MIRLAHLTRPLLAAAALLAALAPALVRAESQDDPNVRRARIHYKAAKYADAIRELRIALSRNPQNAEALLWMGKSLARTDDLDKAVEHLGQAIQANPENEETYRELGETQLELEGRARARGESERAKECLQKADDAAKNLVQRKPQDKDSYQFLVELSLHKAVAYRDVGKLDSEQDQYEEALGHCEKVLAIDPNCISVHLTRIRILVDQKRLKEAERRCQEVLRINPKLHSPKITIAKIRRASGDLDGAIGTLTEVIAEKKTQVEALLFRSECYLDKQMYEEALGDANEVIRITNKNPYANFIRGCVYMQLKKLDAAIDEYRQASGAMPKHLPTHYWLARCLIMKDKNREAVDELNIVIKIDPRNTNARLILASTHIQQGYADGAIQVLVDAAQFDPRNPEVLRLLGIAHLNKLEYDRAAQYFRKMIEIDPDQKSARQVLAVLALAKGEIDEAITHAHKALEVDPNNVDVRFVLGRAYEARGRHDGAKAQFERVLELRGRHPGARMGLAAIHIKQGEYDLAQEQLQHCIEEDPKLTEPRYRLAGLFIAQRKYDKAETELTQLLKVENDKGKVHLAMAELHRARGEKEKAFQAARMALTINPKLLPARTFLALLHIADQNWPDALNEYMEALKEDVKYAPAYQAAVIQVYLGHYDEAVKLFEKAINSDVQRADNLAGAAAALQLKGDYRGALASIANADKEKANNPLYALLTANIYLAQADAPNARTVMRGAQSVPDPTREAYLGLVEAFTADPAKARLVADSLTRLIFYGARGWFTQAEEQCANLTKVAPNNPFAFAVLANVYRATSQPEKEIEILERLLDIAPKEPKHRIRLGALFVAVGRFKDARFQFEKAVEIDPRTVEPRLALTQYFLRMTQYDAAIEQAEKVLSLEPNNVDALQAVANAHMASNRPEKAKDALRQLADSKGRGQGTGAEETLIIMAIQEGKPDAAVEHGKKAVEANPRSIQARLLYGQALLAKNRVRDASNQFREALTIDSTDSRALLMLARVYRLTGRLDLALETCDRAAQVAPAAIDVRFELAAIRLAQKQFDGALEEYRAILKTAPNDARAKMGIADATFQRGDHKAAIQQLVDLIREQPLAAAYVQLIAFYKRLGELEKAQAELEALMKATPENLGAIDLAILYVYKGRPDDAVALLDQRYKDKTDPGALLTRGTALQVKGRVEEAVEAFTEARKSAPANPRLAAFLANAQLAAGQGDKARETLTSVKVEPEIQAAYLKLIEAVKADPEKARLTANSLTQAALYADAGWPTLARERYEHLLGSLPGNLTVLHFLADIHERLDENPQAMEVYRAMLKAEANYEPAFRALARHYLTGKQPEKAAEIYSQLHQARPKDTGIRLALATCLQQLKKTDEAVEAYKAIIQAEPNSPVAYNNLAWLYAAETGKLKEAEQLAAKAADLTTPDTAAGAAVRDTLGWIYYLTERYDKALELALQAVEGMPGNAEVHYHLGMIYFKRNLRASAARHLTSALQLDPKFAEKGKIDEVLDKIRQRIN